MVSSNLGTDAGPFFGKAALVTGSTSGIGKSIAAQFLEAGAKVVANYHNDDEKKAATEQEFLELLDRRGRSSDDLLMAQADVGDHAAVASMFDEAEARLGTVEILVNNAGMEKEDPSHELDAESVRKQLAVNMEGPLFCCIRFLRRLMREGKPGAIVNVSSVHEAIPKPGFLVYSVAKGGMGNLTRTLALEYADRGVRVNGVGPGVVDTKMNAFLEDPKKRAEVERHIPQGSLIEAEEVARMVLFLASDRSRHLTGQTIMLDAGLTLYPDFQKNWSS